MNPYGQTTPALLARRDLWHAERWSTTSGPLVIALRAFTLFFLPFLRATGRVVPGAPASFVRRDSIDPFKPTNHLQAPRSGRLLFAYDAAARGDCCESRDSEVMGGRDGGGRTREQGRKRERRPNFRLAGSRAAIVACAISSTRFAETHALHAHSTSRPLFPLSPFGADRPLLLITPAFNIQSY